MEVSRREKETVIITCTHVDFWVFQLYLWVEEVGATSNRHRLDQYDVEAR